MSIFPLTPRTNFSNLFAIELMLIWAIITLSTHFQPIFNFYTLRKHQKTTNFLMFSGGIEVEHWLKLGCIFTGKGFKLISTIPLQDSMKPKIRYLLITYLFIIYIMIKTCRILYTTKNNYGTKYMLITLSA